MARLKEVANSKPSAWAERHLNVVAKHYKKLSGWASSVMDVHVCAWGNSIGSWNVIVLSLAAAVHMHGCLSCLGLVRRLNKFPQYPMQFQVQQNCHSLLCSNALTLAFAGSNLQDATRVGWRKLCPIC